MSKPLYEVRFQGHLLGSYKTWAGLRRKLNNLAQHGYVDSVAVVLSEGIPFRRVIAVTFMRATYGYGWSTIVGQGIPSGDGHFCSAVTFGTISPLPNYGESK